MKTFRFLSLLIVCWTSSAFALNQRDGNPIDELPSYIRKINDWGQRADFSHDGKRILFIEKTYGDAFELELATGNVTPVTHHYYHGGYTRALYLSNGDILLSGCTDFDADNASVNRYDKAELWVLDKSLTKSPVRLGAHCFEGPAVSRKKLRIAWTTEYRQYPETYADRECRVHVGDIVYKNGTPMLVNQRKVLSNITNPFFDKPTSIETQNFIGPDETHITMSVYGAGTVSIVDLKTGKIKRVSTIPNHHNEPEGIYPDGKHTLVESSRQFLGQKVRNPVQYIDIWKLSLDGSERWKRITHFTDYKGYKSSNPVVSDDGRYIAFQMAKLGDPAGVGRGLFLLDIKAMEALNVKSIPSPSRILYQDDFDGHLDNWVVEQMPGGSVLVNAGKLEINDVKGCTVWFREKLEGPIMIEYEAVIIKKDGPHDRGSDLNCFWMAQDPRSYDNLFAGSRARGGRFSNYHPLRLYYVGYGANHNTTTRFRRYTGTGERPVLPEHDLSDDKYMLKYNIPIKIQLIADGKRIAYLRDGEVIYDVHDPDPYTDGWFGFRTVNNHMTIDNFKVYRLRK